MDAEILEASLTLVDTPDDALSARFHAILRERHPWMEPPDRDDAVRHAKLLRAATLSVADHLGDPVWLAETLGELGGRDAGWSRLAPMCDVVTECLVAAMAERGGGAWTAQMSDAWTAALDAVLRPMVGPVLGGMPVPDRLAG